MSSNGLERAARSSRGKRMAKLLDEEMEADDDFWNQAVFNEDDDDNEYESEDEEVDTFDSDFDEDESDEEEAQEEEREAVVRKKLKAPGTSHEKKKKENKEKEKKEKKEKKKASSPFTREEASPADSEDWDDTTVGKRGTAEASQEPENGDAAHDVDGERSVRKSTRTAVVIKQAEREAQQAALQAFSKPVPKKKKEEERKITQEEMLLEAAQTEIQNLKALEVMLAREEEVKRKAVIQKTIYTGPQIRFHSKDGINVVGFTKVTEFPELLGSAPPSYPQQPLCVVTGLPAKYRDPKTDLPYATKEAFKILRETYDKGEKPRKRDPLVESHQRKRTKVERERSGHGSRIAGTKLKFKKVTSKGTGDVPSVSRPSVSTAPTILSPVQGEAQSLEPILQEPLDLTFNPVSSPGKNSIDRYAIAEIVAASDLASLDMPGSFVEASETDFLLDDFETSITSNSGLSPSMSIDLSPGLHSRKSGDDMSSIKKRLHPGEMSSDKKRFHPGDDKSSDKKRKDLRGFDCQNLFPDGTPQLPSLDDLGCRVKEVL